VGLRGIIVLNYSFYSDPESHVIFSYWISNRIKQRVKSYSLVVSTKCFLSSATFIFFHSFKCHKFCLVTKKNIFKFSQSVFSYFIVTKLHLILVDNYYLFIYL